MSEYPTEEELVKIRTWDLSSHHFSSTIFQPLVTDLLEFIEDCWHWPDRGYKLTGKRILKFELHTGGWSGNESIIEALQENFMFWGIYWQKSIRGGHYYFRIPLNQQG